MWKDVDGILTADPRVCETARPVPRVSFDEAEELAYFGAQAITNVTATVSISEYIRRRLVHLGA